MPKIDSSVPARAWPSEVYVADKLHRHFTCGFGFRYSISLPFAAVLTLPKGLIIGPVETIGYSLS